jgi:hypothetical protein
MNNWFKRHGMHFAVAAIFLVICFFYFTPAFQGKTLGQVDVLGAQSTQKEINDYKAKGITILWTNQIFGGMPAYQIWAPYADNITTWIVNELVVIFPNPIYDVLLLMFGTYFLFTVLKLNPWLAAAGAIAFTFSSYNIVLLVAGHSNQALAIAFFAPIIASVILTLRGKYILGGALTAFFMAMEFKANHIQMTYYLLMALFILICIELYHAIKEKTTPAFLKSVATLACAIVLALMVNASLLWSTQEYSKYSYRGPSNLSQHTAEPSNGLAKTYAYEYSQGVGECFTFFIPNAYGGASGANESIDQNSATAKIFIAKQVPEDQAVTDAQQITSQFPGLGMYWGNKPGTAGPFYFGAVICFLFLFGLLIVKSRIKWWLLGTVVLTMLLSFGANWPVLSDLFFNYFPLYNKFRTVESILAVASICFPILAFLAVREMIDTKDKKPILKKLMLTLYISGGVALILLAVPTVFFDFKPTLFQTGISYLTQALKGDGATANALANAIVSDRVDLERADAFRTLIFVVLTFALLWAFIKQKVNLTVLSIGLLVLITIDMWQVDRRYLKDSNFQDKADAGEQIRPRGVDSLIARDPDPDFRVFDLSDAANIKQDNFNPFFHKSISGYSAARLKRYDELLDNQFSKSVNIDVLNMLNTKYIIIQTDPKAQTLAVQGNKTACGNAWFVKTIKYVNNADEEMQALTSFPAQTEAIVDVKYKSLIPQGPLSADTTSTIKLSSYSPDDMVYKSSASATSVAVFSEIYYDKGWTMTIDGKEQPYFRADYLLRAAQIPAGSHTVEFIFHPASYYTGEKISLAGSILLVLALGGAGYTEIRKKKV